MIPAPDQRKPPRPRTFDVMGTKPLLFRIAGRVVCMSRDAVGIGDCWKSAYWDWSGEAILRRASGAHRVQ